MRTRLEHKLYNEYGSSSISNTLLKNIFQKKKKKTYNRPTYDASWSRIVRVNNVSIHLERILLFFFFRVFPFCYARADRTVVLFSVRFTVDSYRFTSVGKKRTRSRTSYRGVRIREKTLSGSQATVLWIFAYFPRAFRPTIVRYARISDEIYER